MRFEDEQYSRLYKRDTTTWKMIPWQSRCILPLILRKVDRAGLLDLGEDGLEALAVHIEVPLSLVQEGMPDLLRRGVLVLRGDGLLLWPKFIEAQEAKQSDKARQKSARDRARDLASAATRGIDVPNEPVTPCDEPSRTVTVESRPVVLPSHAVTARHTVSQGVTLSSAQLSSAEPIAPNGTVTRTKTKIRKTGSRLPDTWTVSETLAAWARIQGISDRDVSASADHFRDHWLAADHRNAIKADWDAAFRTWVRRDIEAGKIVPYIPAPVAKLEPRTPEQLEAKRKSQEVLASALAEMDARAAARGA